MNEFKYLFSRFGLRVWYHYKNTVSRIQVYFINFRNLLEKGQKLLTFMLYHIIVLKENPFKISGSSSMPEELPELFPFPKNKN